GCDSVDGLGNVNCHVAMAKPKSVTATFALKTFTVVVAGPGSSASAGSSTVTGIGFNCTITNGVASGTCAVDFTYHSSITLTESRPAARAASWSITARP